MRVLVCSDSIGALSSAQAGAALAAGWAGQATAVMPAGEAGGGLLAALADRAGAELLTDIVGDRLVSCLRAGSLAAVAVPGSGLSDGPIPYGATSAALGRAVREILRRDKPQTLILDLVCDDVHDGGVGFLAGLGATADVPLDAGIDGVTGLTEIDLGPARELLGGVDLIGVVPSAQRDRLLLGLRGITSVRGRAVGEDPARLLAADAALATLTAMTAPDRANTPGAGACGGVGFAVLALGGRLTTGPSLALDRLRPPVDLVVTGCSVFDFASRGGGVVAAAAQLAERLLCPCLVIAGEVLIGGREMRTMGIEAAYPVRDSGLGAFPDDVSVEQLSAVATRVARSWTW